MHGRSPTVKMKESEAHVSRALQRQADHAHVFLGTGASQRVAQAANVGQRPLHLVEHGSAALGRQAGQGLHRTCPVGVPVDCLAVLVQLRLGEQLGRVIAQPTTHDAPQLRRGVVQRLAADVQRTNAAARRDDQRGLAGHFAKTIAAGIWRL